VSQPDLVRFAREILDRWPDTDIDGHDLQELAVSCGLLVPVTRVEPCGEDCACVEYHGTNDLGQFVGAPVTCYRRVPLAPEPSK
jgi:hypothetical protein